MPKEKQRIQSGTVNQGHLNFSGTIILNIILYISKLDLRGAYAASLGG